jgi:hypothetical protein
MLRSISPKRQPSALLSIHLDRFKPLFREALKLDYELGFSFSDNDKFEISKGEDTVTIPYRTVLAIHTHPGYLYDSDFRPPTHLDYAQCIWDSFSSNSINAVIDSVGMWVYSPNRALRKEVKKIQPDIRQLVEEELQEGEYQKLMHVSDKLGDLIDVVMHNTNQALLHLTCPRDFLIWRLLNELGMDEDSVKDLSKSELLELADWERITLQEYIQEVSDITGSGLGLGFDVSFIPWDEEFKVETKLIPTTVSIFREIRKRGLATFDETDADILREVADSTPMSRILRKNL